MAVTQRQRTRTVVNSARKNASRRKLSAAQIAAGFGGKRRQAAQKSARKAARKQHSGPSRVNKSSHRPRTVKRSAPRRTQPNVGKIISFDLPQGAKQVATTKRNASKHKSSRPRTMHNRKPKHNPSHRRRTRKNPGLGDIGGLVTSAVFTIAGAVGTQQVTQLVLQSNNTGIMGYFGNLVTAFILSWAVKSFMKNEKAAAAVLAGGFVEIVLRLIADYTPFGQYTSSLGMGDYLAQNFLTPQRMTNGLRSAEIQTTFPTGIAPSSLSGCNGSGAPVGASLYSMGAGLYNM